METVANAVFAPVKTVSTLAYFKVIELTIGKSRPTSKKELERRTMKEELTHLEIYVHRQTEGIRRIFNATVGFLRALDSVPESHEHFQQGYNELLNHIYDGMIGERDLKYVSREELLQKLNFEDRGNSEKATNLHFVGFNLMYNYRKFRNTFEEVVTKYRLLYLEVGNRYDAWRSSLDDFIAHRAEVTSSSTVITLRADKLVGGERRFLGHNHNCRIKPAVDVEVAEVNSGNVDRIQLNFSRPDITQAGIAPSDPSINIPGSAFLSRFVVDTGTFLYLKYDEKSKDWSWISVNSGEPTKLKIKYGFDGRHEHVRKGSCRVGDRISLMVNDELGYLFPMSESKLPKSRKLTTQLSCEGATWTVCDEHGDIPFPSTKWGSSCISPKIEMTFDEITTSLKNCLEAIESICSGTWDIEFQSRDSEQKEIYARRAIRCKKILTAIISEINETTAALKDLFHPAYNIELIYQIDKIFTTCQNNQKINYTSLNYIYQALKKDFETDHLDNNWQKIISDARISQTSI